MKATKDKTENHQAYLTIQVEPGELEKSLEGAYHRLVQKARVPGFRKGKAPRAILERYIGKESLFDDALDHLVPEIYDQVLKEQAIEPIAQPQIEVTQTDPVIFKAVVPLKPVVKLGNYHSIKVEPEPVQVTEKNVDDVIEQLRHQHATWEPVERAVDFDDLVVFDIDSTVEGQTFMKQQGAQFQVIKGQVFPISGFSEQIAGMKKNEEKEFKLPLPADYQRKEMAGKEVTSKVKINEIKQEKLPEVNEDLAKAVSADLLTVEALREQASKELKLRAEERNKIDFEERVIDAVVDLSQIEFPPILVESEINRILNQRFQNNRQSMEDYLRMMNKTEVELRDELRPSAVKGVSRSLALSQVAEEGKVEATDADIDAEIEKMIKDSTQKKEDLLKFFNTPDIRRSIYQTLFSRKTIQLLTDIAQVGKESEEPENTKESKEIKKPKKAKNKKEEK